MSFTPFTLDALLPFVFRSAMVQRSITSLNSDEKCMRGFSWKAEWKSAVKLEVSHMFPMENQEACSMLEHMGQRTPLVEQKKPACNQEG